MSTSPIRGSIERRAGKAGDPAARLGDAAHVGAA
jgi:hypothetical protein